MVVALVINNLFVALVCFGFSQARGEIAKELELLAAFDTDGDGEIAWLSPTHLGLMRQ